MTRLGITTITLLSKTKDRLERLKNNPEITEKEDRINWDVFISKLIDHTYESVEVEEVKEFPEYNDEHMDNIEIANDPQE